MKRLLSAALFAAPLPAAAQTMEGMAMPPAPQDHAGHAMGDMHDMPMDGMEMPGHTMSGMSMGDPTMPAAASGTSRLPAADGMMQGVMLSQGQWMVMAHGYLWGVYTDQGGPRGGDEALIESMAMLTASHDLGGATLQLRSMFSLEPGMGQRGYPNLFATGETAHGAPLVDRQHPHDLFMELAARVDVPLGNGITGFVYGGPVGEPALGPPAFMHRKSDQYLPLSPITHHWFDSTHITYGVVTTGLSARHWQIEGSAFNGREPDEHRWDIEAPRLDSWSLRFTWTPSRHWAAQVSHGWLGQPEATHPGEDEARTTASVHYASGTGVSAMLGYARKDRLPGTALDALLGEVNWDVTRHHSLFGRVEHVANDELFPDHADPRHDRTYRVTRFEGGYAYRVPLGPATMALGGSLAAYAKPTSLDSAYGRAPISYTLFAKLSLGS
jgi:hypothetical protein